MRFLIKVKHWIIRSVICVPSLAGKTAVWGKKHVKHLFDLFDVRSEAFEVGRDYQTARESVVLPRVLILSVLF